MSGITLKECLNPMRSRQSKISSQVQKNPLGLIAARPPNFSLTVEWNYSTVTVCYTRITRRLFRQKYGGYRSFGKQLYYSSIFSNFIWVEN